MAQLPNEVEVQQKGDWTYKEDYDESPSSIKIKEKIVEDGYTYTKEFYSSGVVPRTSAIGLNILKKALHVADVETEGLQWLLSYRGED